MKKKLRPSEIIKFSRYSIKINELIFLAVENYCSINGINEDHKNKMLILTAFVYEKMTKCDYTRVSLPSSFLKKQFSTKKYKKIKDDCLKVTLDIVRKPHLASGNCFAFKIKDSLYNQEVIVYEPNLAKRTENILKKKLIGNYDKALDFDKLYGDNRVRIQNKFLTEIRHKFTIENIQKIIDQLKKDGYNKFTDNYNPIALFEDFKHGKHFTLDPDKNGRLYNIFVYSKKEFRELLGNEYIEVDLSNSQPYILASLLKCIFIEGNNNSNFKKIIIEQSLRFENTKYIRHYNTLIELNSLIDFLSKVNSCNEETEKNTKISTNNIHSSLLVHFGLENINNLKQEITEFFEMACSGNFYSKVADKFSMNGEDYVKALNLIKKEYPNYKNIKADEITNKMKKLIVKRSFMVWMNGKPQSDRKCLPKEIFYKTFSEISLILTRCKSKFGKTIFHSLVTTLESNLAYSTVLEAYKSKILVGTVHDGFYLKKHHLEQFIKILNSTAKHQINSTPERKIRLF